MTLLRSFISSFEMYTGGEGSGMAADLERVGKNLPDSAGSIPKMDRHRLQCQGEGALSVPGRRGFTDDGNRKEYGGR